jgi:glutathione S-transferase
MLKIYGTENSRAMRPIWTAEEMGLEYELVMMPFPPRVFMEEYLDINMLGTVPYLIDGDVKMTESVAMAQYLVEKYGPTDLRVMPEEKDYPSYLNWLYHADATLTFPIADICVGYAINLAGILGIKEAFKPNITRWTSMLFEREAFIKSKNYKHEEKT